MNHDVEGCVVSGIAALLLLAFAGYCSLDGFTDGQCHERWKYQTTAADTISTIRGGCSLPEAR